MPKVTGWGVGRAKMETWVCWRPELSRLHPTTSLKHCLDQKPPEKLRLHSLAWNAGLREPRSPGGRT